MSEPNEFISENQEIEEYNIEGLDENAQDNSSELTHSTEDETSWIYWFINLKGNDFFCEVDEEYFQDDFNLTGLSQMVPFYDYALDMILDVDIPADHLTDDQMEVVETAAEVLYR
jgi:casein kinase II subunit beta